VAIQAWQLRPNWAAIGGNDAIQTDLPPLGEVVTRVARTAWTTYLKATLTAPTTQLMHPSPSL